MLNLQYVNVIYYVILTYPFIVCILIMCQSLSEILGIFHYENINTEFKLSCWTCTYLLCIKKIRNFLVLLSPPLICCQLTSWSYHLMKIYTHNQYVYAYQICWFCWIYHLEPSCVNFQSSYVCNWKQGLSKPSQPFPTENLYVQ